MFESPIAAEEGTATRWLERCYPPLDIYLDVAFWLLFAAFLVLAILGWAALPSGIPDPKDHEWMERRAKSLPSMFKRLRGIYWLAVAYFIHIVLVNSVDAGMAVVWLKHNNTMMAVEWLLYAVYELLAFIMAFYFIPILQMLGLAYLVSYNAKAHPHAERYELTVSGICFFANMSAWFWGFLAFTVTQQWAPVDAHPFLRILILQTLAGTVFAFLQLSFVFNYRVEQFEIRGIEMHSQDYKTILRSFQAAVTAMHICNFSKTEVSKKATSDDQDKV